MLQVPSIPRPEVPVGAGEEDNVEIRKVGTIRHLRLHREGSRGADDAPQDGELGRTAEVRGRPQLRAHRHGRAPRARGDASRGRHARRARPHDGDPARDGERARDDRARASSRSVAKRPTTSAPTICSWSARARSRSSRCTATTSSTLASLPMRYAGISNCFRREAGSHTARTRRASTACTSSRRSSRSSSACPTRRSRKKSTISSSGTRRRFSRSSRSRTASRSRARARSASVRRASTRSSRGCQGATPTAKRTRARRSATSRRAARTSACAWPDGSMGVPVHAQQHCRREPAHPHPAPREPPERRRLDRRAEGAPPLPQRHRGNRRLAVSPAVGGTRFRGA